MKVKFGENVSRERDANCDVDSPNMIWTPLLDILVWTDNLLLTFFAVISIYKIGQLWNKLVIALVCSLTDTLARLLKWYGLTTGFDIAYFVSCL